MNLLLLERHEIDGESAVVRDRRAEHIATIHRAEAGRPLKVGVVGGRVGRGVVARVSRERVELRELCFDADPPPALPCTLVLALPRPKVARRVLASVASFGIKRIVLTGGRRVEKSYWQSPMVSDAGIRAELLLGLEQACDTVLPVVEKRPHFRHFVLDELAALASGTLGLFAHPDAEERCPRAVEHPVTLVVGPEGGLLDDEVELLRSAGLRGVTLGERALRVEPAVAVLVGRLF